MSVGEQERHDLHEKFVSVFGRKEAATVMSLLPPVGWADVATKRDVDQLAATVDQLAAATRRDFDQLTARVDRLAISTSRDIEQLATSTGRDIEQLATRGEHEQLESRLTARIAEAEKRMLLAMMGVMLTTVIAVSGLAFAAAGLT